MDSARAEGLLGREDAAKPIVDLEEDGGMIVDGQFCQPVEGAQYVVDQQIPRRRRAGAGLRLRVGAVMVHGLLLFCSHSSFIHLSCSGPPANRPPP
ncbi:hypothetical protein ASF21_15945 [Arthrobacter sp. Leaf234]|uniref:hypothetical protein n=1 Tax=Arthrobacter sp. Leaf234 TaxID=1736303 RepID=UPI0006FDB557|nr:hypothetical protein [Arthrobacter sp. Leaf234]KQN95682.1 hypothetical protein ASF21_15945 [Arthrobacter sp. Leaf234]